MYHIYNEFCYHVCMKKNILYVAGGVIAVLVLAFAYYAISPLFRNIKVDDAAPIVSDAEDFRVSKIVDTLTHPASGTVRVIDADNKKYIRYENFKTINGPDVYVYLAKDLDAKEYVNLGSLRATEGNINYEIPADINIADYRYVMVWCKAFGVLFNYADLTEKI